MDFAAAMKALERAGTPQNRKVFPRHGAREPMFGVPYADLERLAKSVGRDSALAEALWRTGVHDARVLSSMVDDPAAVSATRLEARVRDVDRPVAMALATCLVAASPHAVALASSWSRDAAEGVAATGWTVVSAIAMRDRTLPEAWFEERLRAIEHGIRGAPNRVKEAMNGALCAIGGRSDALEKAALAATKRIGRVEVDHGDTDCKTPDAATYIPKVRAHARAREEKMGRRGRP